MQTHKTNTMKINIQNKRNNLILIASNGQKIEGKYVQARIALGLHCPAEAWDKKTKRPQPAFSAGDHYRMHKKLDSLVALALDINNRMISQSPDGTILLEDFELKFREATGILLPSQKEEMEEKMAMDFVLSYGWKHFESLDIKEGSKRQWKSFLNRVERHQKDHNINYRLSKLSLDQVEKFIKKESEQFSHSPLYKWTMQKMWNAIINSARRNGLTQCPSCTTWKRTEGRKIFIGWDHIKTLIDF